METAMSLAAMEEALEEGAITEEEFKEWLGLNLRLSRLEKIQKRIETLPVGEDLCLTQAEIATIYGMTQQGVALVEKKALKKIRNIHGELVESLYSMIQ